MNRTRARAILDEIRVGKRYCRPSDHFETEARDEDFSVEDVWYALGGFSFHGDPEPVSEGVWRVRIQGRALDSRRIRIVLDLSEVRASVYVTIHAL